MGVCQSQPFVVEHNGVVDVTCSLKGRSSLVKERSTSTTTRATTAGGGATKPKLTIVTTTSKEEETTGFEAPLTCRTAAETPLSALPSPSPSPPLTVNSGAHDADEDKTPAEPAEAPQPFPQEELAIAPQPCFQYDDEHQEEEIPHDEHKEEEIPHGARGRGGGAGLSLVHFFQSLRHTEELDPVIPEEVDPDAPSDEEDERLLRLKEEEERSNPPIMSTLNKRITSSRGVVVGSSPPRPQDCIRLKHSRMTHPHSIVNRTGIAIATQQDHGGHSTTSMSSQDDSVNASTLSEFRKLKVQVKLAARAERKKLKIAKLEDRYQDVRGYNNLWEEFEELRVRAETDAPTSAATSGTLKRSNSFDLHDTGSWFFDFSSFDEDDHTSGVFDLDGDDQSQSSLSLHSTTSMESQRRYFEEKRQSRLKRRSNSDTNLFHMNPLIRTRQQQDRKPPTEEVSPKKFQPQHRATASTPPSILRSGNTNNESSNTVAGSSDGTTGGTANSRGPVAPTVDAFQIATGQPEYHVYKRPGEKPVTEEDDTPKAKSKRKQRSIADSGEVDRNNDYQVARRRRAPSYSDVDASTLTTSRDDSMLAKNEREVAESLGIHLPPSPVKRDFEYSSFGIDVVPIDSPEVTVMRMTPKDDETCTRKEKVVTGNAVRCLEEAFARSASTQGGAKKERPDVRDFKPPVSSINFMSTEEFLRFSDGHALVNVKRRHGHAIFREADSFRSDDKENDTSAYDEMADDVTQQIDVILAKYRGDNEDAGERSPAREQIETDEGTIESETLDS